MRIIYGRNINCIWIYINIYIMLIFKHVVLYEVVYFPRVSFILFYFNYVPESSVTPACVVSIQLTGDIVKLPGNDICIYVVY